ncbi:MAG: LysM peptidoglycan-binding domain-containing protein [Bacteroidia bacterium]
MRKLYLLLFCLMGLSAFAQESSPQPALKMTVDQYIEKYSSLAVDEMYRSKIPASITLAQGILESGNGNSRLATEANNHFGIKCKASWTGKTMYEDDDAPQECFRKYDAAIDSYRDHSDFLMKNSRYAFLFDLDPTDYKAWAHGLKKAGYATNPQYAELLITFIERHKLHKFDGVKLSEEEDRENKEEKAEIVKSYGKEIMVNGVPGIVAKPNDSYAQIALDYDMKVYQLYRNNDLPKDAVCKAGDTVYLKPKKNKSDIATHLVGDNETMFLISQRYAVKLEKLLDRNELIEGQEPAVGEIIYLRDSRDKAPKLRDTSLNTKITEPIRIDQTEPLKVEIKTDTSILASKVDTQFNEKVYEDPIKNIETQKPVLSEGTKPDENHDFRENLSFFHTVQKGETLYGISKKYGVRVDAIQFLNVLSGDSIEVGQRLIINPAIKSADTKDPQTVPGVHVVRQGETLFSISRLYNLKPADIKATNNLSSDQIGIGQVLTIVPAIVEKDRPNTNEMVFHTASEGETLFLIARKYGVTEKSLKELNKGIGENLKNAQKIRIR